MTGSWVSHSETLTAVRKKTLGEKLGKACQSIYIGY